MVYICAERVFFEYLAIGYVSDVIQGFFIYTLREVCNRRVLQRKEQWED